jgi:peptidoglycan hydrolase FlgJ
MNAPSVSGAGGTPVDSRDASLRKSAQDLQGLFVQQLYKAMRETVPTEGGLVDQTQGEEIFSGLMDERIAADTGTRWHRGLGDAIYRALRQKAGIADPAVVAPALSAGAVPSSVQSVVAAPLSPSVPLL